MQKARSSVSVVPTRTRTAKMWEIIGEKTGLGYTARMKVPGGWLVLIIVATGTGTSTIGRPAITYMPDPNHYWNLEEQPAE